MNVQRLYWPPDFASPSLMRIFMIDHEGFVVVLAVPSQAVVSTIKVPLLSAHLHNDSATFSNLCKDDVPQHRQNSATQIDG